MGHIMLKEAWAPVAIDIILLLAQLDISKNLNRLFQPQNRNTLETGVDIQTDPNNLFAQLQNQVQQVGYPDLLYLGLQLYNSFASWHEAATGGLIPYPIQ